MIPVTPVTFLLPHAHAGMRPSSGRVPKWGQHEHDNLAGADDRRGYRLRSATSRSALDGTEGRTRDARNNAVADLHPRRFSAQDRNAPDAYLSIMIFAPHYPSHFRVTPCLDYCLL